MMGIVELAELVERTRAAQKAFFKGKTVGALRRSKDLEAVLDRATAEILAGPGLFDERPTSGRGGRNAG